MSHPAALVIGATGGLGRGCVHALARDWPGVAIGYRSSREQADALAAELPAGKGFPIRCDVGDDASVRTAIETVVERFGAIGTVIFASGVAIDQPFISQIGEKQWRDVIETELLGFTRVVAAVLPIFRKQKRGNFVAVTSMANTRFVVGDALSAIPKAGIEALSRGIAKEEGRHGIRSNTVAPGAMDAGLGAAYIAGKFSSDFWETFKRSIPLRRFGTAADVGEAAAFFASDRAGYLTGQTLVVDGGYST